VDDRRKCQTSAATPAKPGDLLWEVRSCYPDATRGHVSGSIRAQKLNWQARWRWVSTSGQTTENQVREILVAGFAIEMPDWSKK
jgi:hypothetical protein